MPDLNDRESEQLNRTNRYLADIAANLSWISFATCVIAIDGCLDSSGYYSVDKLTDALKEQTIEIRQFREEFSRQEILKSDVERSDSAHR